MHEGELGGPIGRKVRRRTGGEMDVGGEGGAGREEARFNVDAVELD